jgi:uncharacterized membrane protein
VAAEYFVAMMFAWTALLPLTHRGSGSPAVWGLLGLTLVFVVVVTVLLVRLGQGGVRAAQSASAGAIRDDGSPVGDRTADRYWKAGLLYVNADDPAIFVEKRFGLGYTVNFGRPASWIILAALLLIPLVLGLVVKWGGN